jgi:hypothetical protein
VVSARWIPIAGHEPVVRRVAPGLPQGLDVDVVRRSHAHGQAVTPVGRARGALRAQGGHVDRRVRLLDRLGGHRDVVELKILALMAEPFLGPALLDDLQRLVGAAERLPAGYPEYLALLLHRARSHGEVQAAVRQDVHHGGVLRYQDGIVEGQEQDVRAQPDPARLAGQGGQDGQGRRVVRVVGEVVLGQPDVAVPELVTEDELAEELVVKLGQRPRPVTVIPDGGPQSNVHDCLLSPCGKHSHCEIVTSIE